MLTAFFNLLDADDTDFVEGVEQHTPIADPEPMGVFVVHQRFDVGAGRKRCPPPSLERIGGRTVALC